MYHDIPAEILRVLEPVVRAHGLEVVDAVLGRGRGRSRLEVTLDTPGGDGRVTVDQCAAVSRELGSVLDAGAVIEGAYVLEVGSPGVDRRLGREIDFERVVGRTVAVETREALEGRRNFRGELLAFDGARARVQTEAGPFEIPFALIRRAQAFHPFPPFRTPVAKR